MIDDWWWWHPNIHFSHNILFYLRANIWCQWTLSPHGVAVNSYMKYAFYWQSCYRKRIAMTYDGATMQPIPNHSLTCSLRWNDFIFFEFSRTYSCAAPLLLSTCNIHHHPSNEISEWKEEKKPRKKEFCTIYCIAKAKRNDDKTEAELVKAKWVQIKCEKIRTKFNKQTISI